MTTEITVPDFRFTAFYYPQLVEALREYGRRNVPELTDESDQEPMIQLERMLALVGHINAVRADLVANESTLPTAQLRASVANLLELIDYRLASAAPGATEVVFVLAQVLAATVEVIPANAQVATRSAPSDPARIFEALTALLITRTDRIGVAFTVEDGVFTDVTASINDGTAGNEVTPWATPVGGSSSREGDSIIFGHPEIMWDRLGLTLDTAGAGLTGVWEYFDGRYDKANPTSVTDNGTTLTFDLTGYLGTDDLRGTPIRVRLNSSGAYEDLFSDFVGGVNVVTSGLLGQSSPTVLVDDYTVGGPWERFSTVVDGTVGFQASGNVDVALPQTVTEDWDPGTVNSTVAYWMRFRIITAAAPVSPIIDLARIDQGGQYAKALVTQGQTQTETLGSSDGSANQTFAASRTDYLDDTAQVTVDGVAWARQDNLLSSAPTDRHFTVDTDDEGRLVVVFGDGVNGAIPASGSSNIVTTYRYGGARDGNVGANTITVDKTGLTYVARVYNPRRATGWAAPEGSTPESLARSKILGPASLRTRDVAIGPDDASDLVLRAQRIDSTLPLISRAFAIEEGFGPKTVELVVVAAGGGLLAQSELDALSTFFNGDPFASPPIPKRFVANQRVVVVNYVPRVINITATVDGGRNTTALSLANALTRRLQPEALQADGVTYTWAFGGRVPVSRLEHEIFEADDTVTDADITSPAIDLTLQPRELPVAGTFAITVI